MEIKNPYLVWIGSEHYENFEVYAEEAQRLGVSKRLPGISMGKTLMEPGAVIFVAHDDGETTECPDCLRLVRCPECRKRKREMKDLQAELEELTAKFASEEAMMKSGFGARSHRIRTGKIEKLQAECDACAVCEGKGKAKLGSGGYVKVDMGKGEIKTWDYRTYNYWLHQPEHFDKNCVVENHMCESCGGLGTVPRGFIRGMFIPERIEYISKNNESATTLEAIDGFEIIPPDALKREHKRKCGTRKPGGVYAVTKVGKPTKAAKKAVEVLVEQGLIEEDSCEVFGSFVVFKDPIDISGTKRFRGIKSWPLDPAAERAAKRALGKEEDEDAA